MKVNFVGSPCVSGVRNLRSTKVDKTVDMSELKGNISTVETKKEGEFVIVKGHPKTVYKKNPETGKLEFMTQVYDGSWGPELSDEDLIKSL